jgi:hypothetical protein
MRRLLPWFPLLVAALPLLAQRSPITEPELPAFHVAIPSPIVSLPFRVHDAEFSSALNAIVAVSESPNQLHIYYPDTQTLESVNLQVTPYNVSVSPDGLYAVVGHNAWISWVDLSAPALLKTIPVSLIVNEIVYGPNDHAHAPTDDWDDILSIDLDTETTTTTYGGRSPDSARLHPSLTKIYGADQGVSPDDIMRFNITPTGPASSGYDSIYHGDYSMCGDIWISMDGLRLFTRCGNVFRASDDPSSTSSCRRMKNRGSSTTSAR